MQIFIYMEPWQPGGMPEMVFEYILKQKGLDPAADLSIDLEATKEMFRQTPPDFVSVSAVSNVTGYILPAREIFLMAKEYGAFTLLDAAQAMGLLKLRFSYLRADAITFAGHKTLYAPFGIGGFLLKNGIDLEELLAGGNGMKSLSEDMPRYMPEKMECGSMDTPAIAGLHASLKWLKTVRPKKTEDELMEYLIPKLREIPGLHLYCAPDPSLQAGVISLNLDGFRANEVGAILDKEWDIAVRAGHHCAARIHKHLKDQEFDGTVRVSISAFTTKDELDTLVKGLESIDRDLLKGISSSVLRGNC